MEIMGNEFPVEFCSTLKINVLQNALILGNHIASRGLQPNRITLMSWLGNKSLQGRIKTEPNTQLPMFDQKDFSCFLRQ
jgi:hypothetical protein